MLNRLLASTIKTGTLTIRTPGGRTSRFGTGKPEIGIRFLDRRAALELAVNPELKLGELYMDGRIAVENGDIADLLDLLMHNLSLSPPRGVLLLTQIWRRLTRPIAQRNYSSRAQKNVAHHYDLSGQLYDVFLDRDRQYSCAYFSAPGETLEEAQIGKKRHIAAKLYLDRPGLSVLDIGSGWGGLALDLARDCGAKVLGVTPSEVQIPPALSEVLRVIERAGLVVTDVEVLRLHYAETLKEWRRRFKAQWNTVAELYDERFCRMWEFYLAGSEIAFRRDGLVVFQIQLAKSIDSLPLTRDYMFDAERTMRFAGTQTMPR